MLDKFVLQIVIESTINYIAKQMKIDQIEAMRRFYYSKTYEELVSQKTNLFTESYVFIAKQYFSETVK